MYRIALLTIASFLHFSFTLLSNGISTKIVKGVLIRSYRVIDSTYIEQFTCFLSDSKECFAFSPNRHFNCAMIEKFPELKLTLGKARNYMYLTLEKTPKWDFEDNSIGKIESKGNREYLKSTALYRSPQMPHNLFLLCRVKAKVVIYDSYPHDQMNAWISRSSEILQVPVDKSQFMVVLEFKKIKKISDAKILGYLLLNSKLERDYSKYVRTVPD